MGLGHMGRHMCRHVCAAGFPVSAFDLASPAVEAAAASGARGADSLPDCLREAEILVTSLPGPPQVEAVLGEAIGLLGDGALVIDMSTSSLEVGRRVASAAGGGMGELIRG